jgi:chemotaxis protein MotB
MARKKKYEEHSNHEAWAIPYGDLVTLLLAFFVVMYAVSSVNEGKYRVLSDALNAAFRGAPKSIEPVQLGANKKDGLQRQAQDSLPLNQQGPFANPLHQQGRRRESDTYARELQQVAASVELSVASLVAEDLVVVKRNDSFVEVEIKSDMLFATGSAVLAPDATDVIVRLADVLRDYKNAVRVEGHTDNLPISTSVFPSNWELSAARAASVVQVLARSGVTPGRLAVLGLAEFRPIATNATPEGRNTNRRVSVVILSSAPGKDSRSS